MKISLNGKTDLYKKHTGSLLMILSDKNKGNLHNKCGNFVVKNLIKKKLKFRRLQRCRTCNVVVMLSY